MKVRIWRAITFQVMICIVHIFPPLLQICYPLVILLLNHKKYDVQFANKNIDIVSKL